MKSIYLALAAFVISAGCTPVESGDERTPAPQETPFHVVAEFGGEDAFTYALDASDSTVVFGRGSAVIVADVSDPSRPRVLGTASLSGVVRDVVLRGAYVYVAADSGGLHILDASDRSDLELVAEMQFGDRAYGVDADGSHAYVAARSEGLRIIDISDPAAPVEIGSLVTPDEAVDVVVRDDVAYVAAWYESMRTIDVSDPRAPVELSFAAYDSYDNGAAWSVHVDGDIGLAAVPEMGLRTVDISDPGDVKLYKVYRGLLAPAGAAVRGRTAFVADQDAGFRVLDLADPVQPVEIGTLRLAGRAMAVSLNGEVAYIAAREAGLRIVDISRPYDPREIAHIDDGDAVADLFVAGDTLFAAGDQNGVSLHRASAEWQRSAFIPGAASRTIAVGRWLLVARKTGIALFDRSDLTRPVSEVGLPAAPRGFDMDGDRILVAVEQFGIRLLTRDAAGELREVGAFEPDRAVKAPIYQQQVLRTPPAAWDVVVTGGGVAAAAFDDGIRMIDVSNPAQPALLALHATPERAYRLVLRDGRLFAACDDGLRVIDLSDPTDPAELGYVKTPSFATSLALDGDSVYVGDLSGMLTITSATAPSEYVSTVKVADRILGLARVHEAIAVATGPQGVRIIEDAATRPVRSMDEAQLLRTNSRASSQSSPPIRLK